MRANYTRDPIDLELSNDQILYMFWLPHLKNLLDLPKMMEDFKAKQTAGRVLAQRMDPAHMSMFKLIRTNKVDFSQKMTTDKRAKTYKALCDWSAEVNLEKVRTSQIVSKKRFGIPVVCKSESARTTMRQGELKLLEIWRDMGHLQGLVECAGTEAGRAVVEGEMQAASSSGFRRTMGWISY